MSGATDPLAIERAIAAGDIGALEAIAGRLPDFPAGVSPWHTPWISAFAARAPPPALRWALARGAPADPEAPDGFPPLHAALDGPPRPWRHETLAILIAAGADVNRRGVNGWTPLHMAALADDLPAMRLLLDAGADRGLRTGVDENATPEEEARRLGHPAAADFLRDGAR